MKTTIDSQQLRVYVALARSLNMAITAAELGLTTSGVSHCLKALERDLGCALFERRPRSLALTEAGEEFLEEARSILDHMEVARRKIQGWANADGRVRIGASSTACRYILAPALREFRESYPAFSIRLQPTTATVPPDLTITADAAPSPRMSSIPIGEDELQLYAHPLHPWVIQRKIDRDDLARHKLVLPASDSPSFARIWQYFQEEGTPIKAFIEVDDESAALELVRLDIGAGILPRWIAADSVREGTLVGLPLGRRRLKRHWVALHRTAQPLDLPENLLISLCRAVFARLIPKSETCFPLAPDAHKP